MTPEQRRRLAIEAAVGVAEELGIGVERPRVLKDSNNTIVHLASVAVVAKVGTSHFATHSSSRWTGSLRWLRIWLDGKRRLSRRLETSLRGRTADDR